MMFVLSRKSFLLTYILSYGIIGYKSEKEVTVMARIGIDINDEQHKKIKLISVKEGTTIRKFCLYAILKRVEEYEKQKASSIHKV